MEGPEWRGKKEKKAESHKAKRHMFLSVPYHMQSPRFSQSHTLVDLWRDLHLNGLVDGTAQGDVHMRYRPTLQGDTVQVTLHYY